MAKLKEHMLGMPIDLSCGLLDVLKNLGLCREAELWDQAGACQKTDVGLEPGDLTRICEEI